MVLAVKAFKKKEMLRLKQVDHVVAECSILGTLKHPFVVTRCGTVQVRCEGVAQDPHHLYLFLEYVQGGELYTYLRAQEKLSLDHARFYLAIVVLIFEALHAKNIIYRYLLAH